MADVGEVQDHFTMTDGFNLFYRCWLKRALVERVVVGIHGGGDHSGDFRAIGPQLASDGNQVYAFDLRGFGNSQEQELPRGDTRDFTRHLKDIDDAIQHVKKKHPGKKLYVLGYSMGGCYALWYAARYPDALDGLVLVAPAIVVRVLSSRQAAIQLSLANLVAPRRMLDVSRSSYVEGRNPELLKLQLQDPLGTGKLSYRYLANIRKTLMDKALENAARIEKPTLILQGDADVSALPHGAKRLHESLKSKDKTIQTFPDADHRFYDIFTPVPLRAEQDPAKMEQVFSVIKDWLRAH